MIQSRMRDLGVFSVVKSRGGIANWKNNREKLLSHAKARGTPHFRLASKPEIKIFEALKSAGFNIAQTVQVSNMKVDMLIDGKIVIEYDGSGHWMRDKPSFGGQNGLTSKIDFVRDIILKKMGYRVLRVDAPKDKVNVDVLIETVKEFINGDRTFLRWHA